MCLLGYHQPYLLEYVIPELANIAVAEFDNESNKKIAPAHEIMVLIQDVFNYSLNAFPSTPVGLQVKVKVRACIYIHCSCEH